MSPVTVIFLDKNRIQFYESRDKTLASLEVSSDLVKDLEIVDATALAGALKSFLSQHRITSSPVVMILSDAVTCSQELTGSREEKDQQFQQFLSAVPFEMVQWRKYAIAEKELAIAVPRSGFEPLIKILEEARFPVVAVVPIAKIGSMSAKRWLDAEMGVSVASEASTLVSESIMPVETKVSIPPGTTSALLARRPNRLAIFIGLFIVLLFVLFLLLIGRV